MKELKIGEIQLVSGGDTYGLLLDVSLTCVGAYLGAQVASLEPFMVYVGQFAPGINIQTQTISPIALIPSIIYGASMGFGLSRGIQIVHNALKTEESSSK